MVVLYLNYWLIGQAKEQINVWDNSIFVSTNDFFVLDSWLISSS